MSRSRMSSPFLSSSRLTIVWASSSGFRNHLIMRMQDWAIRNSVHGAQFYTVLGFAKWCGEHPGVNRPFRSQFALEKMDRVDPGISERSKLEMLQSGPDLLDVCRGGVLAH